MSEIATRLKKSSSLFMYVFVFGLVMVGWFSGDGRAQVPPALEEGLPEPLSTVPVVLDPTLFTDFVQDRDAAILLGKALFWDMNIGSDGQACASCHFAGGITR